MTKGVINTPLSQVLVFPRGQLSIKDKERLTRHGIVAVEADDPSKVVAHMPGVPLVSGDDILCSALDALTKTPQYGSHNSTFVAALARRVLAKEEKKDA